MANSSDLVLTQGTGPSLVPPSGTCSIYPKNDGAFYTMNDAGVESSLIGPRGLTGSIGATGPGVPAGGSTGQILAKSSGTSYATGWVTPPTPAMRFVDDLIFDGVTTVYTVSVGGNIADATQAIWHLTDASDDYCGVFPEIRATGVATVTITASPALPAGTYRLIGIQ